MDRGNLVGLATHKSYIVLWNIHACMHTQMQLTCTKCPHMLSHICHLRAHLQAPTFVHITALARTDTVHGSVVALSIG